MAVLAALTPEALAACLTRELRDAAREEAVIPEREEAVAIFRRYLGRYQADIRNRFERYELKGAAAAKMIASFTDVMLRAIVDLAMRATEMVGPDNMAMPVGGLTGFSMAATGGYGRGLLAPFSDIDLLFLIADDAGERVHPLIEYVLYFLWDLGVKVGHATRTVNECITEPPPIPPCVQPCWMPACWRVIRRCLPCSRPATFLPVWKPAWVDSFRTSGASGWSGTAVLATARIWSSPISRKGVAVCGICRPCTGCAATRLARATSRTC